MVFVAKKKKKSKWQQIFLALQDSSHYSTDLSNAVVGTVSY